MPKIGIILGSTRPGRKAESLRGGSWTPPSSVATRSTCSSTSRTTPATARRAAAAADGPYTKPHTLTWAATVAALDGFVFVTPEYNHSTSAALKNAIDFLYAEWGNKAAGFVSYGASGGTRAVEHLRLVMAELEVATVRAQVGLSLRTDFTNYRDFTPHPAHQHALAEVLDQVVAWSTALEPLRAQVTTPVLRTSEAAS
jgi:NAD(P)H-dependent FMN reductase